MLYQPLAELEQQTRSLGSTWVNRLHSLGETSVLVTFSTPQTCASVEESYGELLLDWPSWTPQLTIAAVDFEHGDTTRQYSVGTRGFIALTIKHAEELERAVVAAATRLEADEQQFYETIITGREAFDRLYSNQVTADDDIPF